MKSAEGLRRATVRAGFIPLVDCAVLAAAAELGFAARQGVSLRLTREASWANIRDRMALGAFDAAHMLSPMPIASALGLGPASARIVAPFALGRGGNAITVSLALFRRMEAAGFADTEGPAAAGAALKAALEETGPPTFGMVHPFSMHNYELRYFMAAAGIHPDSDARLVVIPPPLMVDALRAGDIDGFCVGAPWNAIAVQSGLGRIVTTRTDLWPGGPEKVLGVRLDFAEKHPGTLDRLLVALDEAARWCDAPENRPALADLLSAPLYVGAPASVIRRILEGEIVLDPAGRVRTLPDFFAFHRQAANLPRPGHALWIYSQMARWGQVAPSRQAHAAAAAVFRPDLYRRALGPADAAAPGEALFDGRPFDPDRVEDYLDGFAVHSRMA